ncbi:uncharacterized protein LOC120331661 [Styela clava]
MSAIHYKFSSSNDYKNVTFDGINISLQDCKKAIMLKEKLKMTEVDLLITNAQSLQDYKDESALIPKNTALLVRRIPLGAVPDKTKVYVVKKNETAASSKSDSHYMSLEELRKTEDLVSANASEQDKIKAMMDQSTNEYDPSKYLRPPKYGSYQRYNDHSSLTSYVKCYKCNQSGHYASQCRIKPAAERPKPFRPATGIPRSHMIQVNKETRGAMLTADGQYVVPVIDKKGYDVGKKEKPPFLPEVVNEKEDDEDEPVPDELICLLCKEIMHDAVVIPCCGNSYCDECIRNALLESDDHECPTCHRKNISPDSLIANKFLRQAVNKFRNETGISRKKNAPVWPRPAAVETKPVPTPQPTKVVAYGPPKAKIQYGQSKPSTGGAYVVKARTGQVYNAMGYSVKKAPANMMQPSTPVVTTAATTMLVKSETETPEDVVKQEQVDVTNSPATPDQPPTTNVTPQSDGYTVNSTPDSEESTRVASPATVAGITPLMSVKTERPKINAVNMMIERPHEDSPPPPPPLPPPTSRQPEIDPALIENMKHLPPPSIPVSEQQPVPEPAVPRPPPSLLDDMPPMETAKLPIPSSQGINITLRNAPPVELRPELNPAILDPPLNMPPPKRPGQQLALPPMIQGPPGSFPPRIPGPMTLPPPGMPPMSMAMSVPPPAGPLGGHLHRMLPPPVLRTSGPPPNVPTSIPPPGMTRPPGNMSIPPPMLPPGVRLPFPPPPGVPPPGIPPPGFVKQSPLGQAGIDSQGLPPPPGTGTPPSIPTSVAPNNRSRERHRGSSRSKHHVREERSSKSRKSKLAMMSDEFTKDLQKQRDKVPRKRRTRRGRSESRSRSGSYSSSTSYTSSSSRSSSRSSYSSTASSSYSSSGSYTDSRSRSRTPTRRHQRRTKQRRGKKSESRSYSRTPSRSPTPDKKKRGRKQAVKHRKSSRSPGKRGSGSRRRNHSRSRSTSQSSQRHVPSSRHRSDRERRRRSRSKSQSKDSHKTDGRVQNESEAVIPGMPPQSVLDYERDIALYDYYKQKYEQDWLRSRVLPPSPFKRFINYDPTKFPPPVVHSQPQPVLREIAPHSSLIPIQQAPPLMMYQRQPPPPGDATPTEEDAGMLVYRDRTPERYHVRPGPPAPWDPPAFDGDLAERERLLREEEYYRRMQGQLVRQEPWPPNHRGPPGPAHHFDPNAPRARMDPRAGDRGRYHDDRRRRGRTPPMERGGRDRDGRPYDREDERYSRRRRPEIEETARSGSQRGSRDRDRDRERTSDTSKRSSNARKEGRSSRRDEASSRSSRKEEETRSRKRTRDHDKQQEEETSNRDSRSKKRSRGGQRTETPLGDRSIEPVPPGEGDGTPVRDEALVEFRNESIKIKVFNDKAKPRSEKSRNRDKGFSRDQEDGKHRRKRDERIISDKRDSQRQRRPREQKISGGERKMTATNREEGDKRTQSPLPGVEDRTPETKTTSEPAIERSPTPTLDENISPVLIEGADDPVLDDLMETTTPQPELMPESVDNASNENPELTENENKSHEMNEIPEIIQEKLEEELPQQPERKKSKRVKGSRNVSKTKHRKKPSPKESNKQKDEERSLVVEYDGSGPTPTGDELVQITIPKSKWESDDESGSQRNDKVKAVTKVSPKPDKKNAKSRKIRLKKPGKSSNTEAIKEDKQKNNNQDEENENLKKNSASTVQSKKSTPSPAISDSRRVVVSNEPSADIHSSSKQSRLLRPSISNIDEASFEPDYSGNESEKALSNYAPSDIDASDHEENKKAPREKRLSTSITEEPNPRRKETSSKRGKHISEVSRKAREEKYEDEFADSLPEGSEGDYEKMKKKRKHKKKKKHKKHHRQQSQDTEDDISIRDDYDDENLFQTDSDEEKFERMRQEEERRKIETAQRQVIYQDERYSSRRENGKSKKEQRSVERSERDQRRHHKHEDKQVSDRKRRYEDIDEYFSEEEEDRRSKKKYQGSSETMKRKDKRRRVSDRSERYYDEDDYMNEDEYYQSPEPEERRKHKPKKQKFKKTKKEPLKEVRTVASRIQRSR